MQFLDQGNLFHYFHAAVSVRPRMSLKRGGRQQRDVHAALSGWGHIGIKGNKMETTTIY